MTKKLFTSACLVTLGCAQIFATGAFLATKAHAIPDLCVWNSLDWDELSTRDQQAWLALGWSEALWDSESNDTPPSDLKDWAELSAAEKSAASALGYTNATWEEDGCEE